MSGNTIIAVAGDAPYDITVGRGILPLVGDALSPSVRKVLVVHPPTLAGEAAQLRSLLMAEGAREILLAEVPDAEQGKRVEVAAFCWQVMGQADFTRTDAVVGFGGGAVTDLAGFVAATWLRGVELVQVPTTVLGMVDAAVGGKTGINTAEGKNLVGAFWPPRAVICDLDTLATLSPNERVAGFAEVVKAGFIWYPEILDLIEADPAAATDPATPAFRRCIELAIEMKARVVGEDLREAGLREVLNYGATARRCPSAWCSPPSCRASRAGCRTRLLSVIAASSNSSVCPRPTGPAPGHSCWPPCSATRRAGAGCSASSFSTISRGPRCCRRPTNRCCSPPTRRSASSTAPRVSWGA